MSDLIKYAIDGQEAGKRLAVRQLEKLLQAPIKEKISKATNDDVSLLLQLASSRAGIGLVDFLLGFAPLVAPELVKPYMGMLGPIAKELRTRGMELVGDQLADVLMVPARAFIADLIKNGLPQTDPTKQLPAEASLEKTGL